MEETEEPKEPKEKPQKARLNFLSPTAWILFICFSVSVIILIVYISDIDYPDDMLYFLLVILRYSSFMVFLCAVYKLFLNFYRIFKKHMKIHVIKMVIYFLLVIYGLFIFLLEAVIVVITSGNA